MRHPFSYRQNTLQLTILNHYCRVMASCIDYHHPYTPYKIQLDLMDAIYDTIENNYKVGIFESPTGTGKTLSIICSTMTWLRNYKSNSTFEREIDNEKSANDDEEDEDDEPDWVKEDYKSTILNRSKNILRDYELHLEKLKNEYDANLQEVSEVKIRQKRRRLAKVPSSSAASGDDEYLPRNDEESEALANQNSMLKKEIDFLLKKVAPASEKILNSANDCPIKIYFASRTHSQLNQFSHQLNLTKFNSSFEGINERTKYLPLGSRKQLCINQKVVNVSKNDSSINDACTDLLASKEGCEYLPKDWMNSSLTDRFSDLSLTRIHDIEDLANLGSNVKVCPYYSVRRGIAKTEIVSLPYQMILDESTRQALNLDIENSIIIIDEAHNILDVINSMYSVSISREEMMSVIKSLKTYLGKFVRRLNSGNRINLLKLIKLCQILISYIDKKEKSNEIQSGSEILPNELLDNSNGDLVNIHNIEEFLGKTKIAYKIESYLEKTEEDQKRPSSNPLLFKMVKFLKCLSNPSHEGKFVWEKSGGLLSISYMLLDPSEVFKVIVNKSKCVLLCGGTMEPMSDYINYLFPQVPRKKIKSFSCGHIIPEDNLKVFPITNYNGTDFDFSFSSRLNQQMLENLGETVLQICRTVPYGVVVFFPSYKYLDQVIQVWEKSSKRIFEQIRNLKKVFRESKETGLVENILDDFSNLINHEGEGAILFSVVGGKMSEGINFSDNLARAVVMIGLPYPNAFSGEIVAKKRFIEDHTIVNGGTRAQATENSRSFYDNLCMRAVNQSIGRSIRHIKDYSVIYLIDHRYQSQRIQQKLSGWVKERIEKHRDFQDVMRMTEDFFSSKSIQIL